MSGFQFRDHGSPKYLGQRSESTQILLLLDRGSNRDRLEEWLSDEYEILRPDDGPPDNGQFDLCIVDEPMLENHHSHLHELKARADPVSLPYLLVTNSEENSQIDHTVWELVDEIISVPTQQQTLEHRLSNLLERRELSLELATELDQQRRIFHRLFESSNDAIFVIDAADKHIRECNPRACELLGYSREDLLSLSAKDVHPNERPAFRRFVESVLDIGHGWTEDLTCQTKDGDTFVAEISASALEIEGRPHVLASVRDITTRHEQRQVLDSLHDVTAELMRARTDQEIAEVTVEAAQRVFEYDIAGVRLLNEEVAPATLDLVAATDETYEHVGPEPAAYEVGQEWEGEVFESREPTIIDDLHSQATSVEYGPVRSAMCLPLKSYGVLTIGATEPAAFDDLDFEMTSILATNATAALTRAQREQSLSEQKQYFSDLFENTTDCIADVRFEDGAPHIRDVNPAFERVFGYDSAEIRGESLTELVVPGAEGANSESLVQHALAGNRIETEGRRETATGHRDFLIRVVPVQQDGDNIGAYVVYTDFTEQKRRDQQLQVLNRVLRHNLRNKLNVVRGVLERSRDADQEVPDTLAETGLGAVDELLDLSETARSLSKEMRSETNPDPVSITHIVDRTVDKLNKEYPRAKISTISNVDRLVAGTVQVDRGLRELCENAIEHSDQPTPRVTITIGDTDESDGWVTITVEDDGPGIPDEQQAVLRDGTETQLQHGNGLGLWVVHWIATTAGGELSLSDADDQGATVTLRLPTVDLDDQFREGGE